MPGPVAGPTDPGTWRVVATRPDPGEDRPIPPGGPYPGVDVEVAGEPGYVRATIAVERSAGPGRSALYDVLFPIGARQRIRTSIVEPTDPTGAARVRIQADSGRDLSESFVEPAVPFFASGARRSCRTLAVADGQFAGGAEVPVARWTVEAGADRSEVTIRLLFSKRPTGPRLKPEAKPPR